MAQVEQKGNTEYTFGIPEDDVVVDGLVVETASLRSSAQIEEEAINNFGLVDAFALAGEQYEVTITGLYTSAPPTMFQDITVDDKPMFITGIETAWGNREWKKATITAKGYEGIAP